MMLSAAQPRRVVFLFSLVLVLAGPGAANLVRAQQPDKLTSSGGTTRLPGVLVFKLRPEVRSRARLHSVEHAALTAALAAVGARDLTQQFPRAVAAPPERAAEGVDLTLVYRISYRAGLSFQKVKQRLLASGAIAYVEPLYRREVMFQPNDPFADSLRANNQYHLKNIRAYHAWDLEQGDTSVVVGITDTGTLFSHEDLQGQAAINYADPVNGQDDDNDGFVDNFRGWDVADNDNDASVEPASATVQPSHGVLVSGAVSARTNNGLGVAGVGFRCRYLPIKIYPATTQGGFAGFEGIVYAADHGCQVINCSWGGPGAASQYEQDVITYATVNRNAVVVAAAGNTNADLDFYPASYKGVLSVASLDRNDIKGASNTYSHRVSLSAPGRQIVTTHYINDTTYVAVSGSSFASPMVAGTAALVRHHFPALSAEQVAERVRVTADTSIYALSGNASFQEMLGRGRVNTYRAVADTAVRSVRATVTHFNRTRPYYAGDTLLISADFLNYLAPLRGLTVSLSSASSFVQVLGTGFNAGPLATMASVSNAAAPFQVVLLPGTPLNATIQLRYGFRDLSGYTDYQYFKIEVNPDFVTVDANRVAVTVTSRGNLGFDNGDLRRGDGVTFDRGDLLLTEGGLVVGRSATQVSDMIRSDRSGQPDHDFVSVSQVRLQRHSTIPWADQSAAGIFEDTGDSAQADVRVIQHAWASRQRGRDRFVFLSYDIINQAPDTLTTGYAGLFADWDIRQFEHNTTRWDATRHLAYAYNTIHDSVYAGIKLLTAGPATTYAFDNFNPAATPVNSTNGLTTAEKYTALVAGPGTPSSAGTNALGTDIAQLVSTALPRLAPNDTARVAFAIVLAPDLASLFNAADTAQAMFNQPPVVTGITPSPNQASVALWPNPTTGDVRLTTPTPGHVTVLDALGRVVLQAEATDRLTTLALAQQPPGVYVVRVQHTDGAMVTRRLVRE